MIVQALPPIDEFIELLKSSYADFKDSYAQEEGLISVYTYNQCKEAYTENEMAALNAFMVEHGLKPVETPVLFKLWSRFEDAHMPALSDGIVKKPVRENVDNFVYSMFSPGNFTTIVGGIITVKTGYKAVIPKGKGLLVTVHPDIENKCMLISPGIITGYEDEICIKLLGIADDSVAKHQGLVKMVAVDTQTLNTDNFIPRNRGDLNGTKNVDIKTDTIPQGSTSVETVVD